MTDFDRHEAPDRPPEGAERWMLTIVTAIFIGLVGAEIVTDYEPGKLGAVFILAFWIPLLALHEAGHAVVAALCGWEVERVVIGYGKTIKRLVVGSVPVEIKLLPISGYVLPRPRNLDSPRLKNTLIYAAGPGVEILILLVVFLAADRSVLLSHSQSIPVIAVQSLCVAILMGLAFTLVPHTTTTGGGVSWSDGMGMIRSCRLPDSYFSRVIRAEFENNKPAQS